MIKLIIKTLKEEPLSLRSLDIKLNASGRSIKEYAGLLQDLGIVHLKKNKKGSKTITIAELTKYGKRLKL